jgi:hypothetical protein
MEERTHGERERGVGGGKIEGGGEGEGERETEGRREGERVVCL